MNLLLGVASLVVAVVSCGGSDTTPSPASPPATFTEIYAMLFPVETRGQCNFCHSLPPNLISNGKLSMGSDRATAYAALVNKDSASEACHGTILVVPGHPESSLLLDKLSESPSCGSRMPLGGDPLSAAQLETVRSWIAAGALDD